MPDKPANPRTEATFGVRRKETGKVLVTILLRAPVGPDRSVDRRIANGPGIDAAVVFSKETATTYLRDLVDKRASGEEVRVDADEGDAREFLSLVGVPIWPETDAEIDLP